MKMQHDVVIYGGTCAAVTAAVQVARMGKSVVIVCPETHIGGMTASGLGWTDSKTGDAVGGLAREFYRRIYDYYNRPEAWKQQTRESYIAQKINAQPGPAIDTECGAMWTLEPHVAEKVFEDWLAQEKITVFRGEHLDRANGVEKRGNAIVSLATLSGKRFEGKAFIDAGYEGDLMAAAKVTYRVGRDSAKEYGEPLNGIRFRIPRDRDYAQDEFPGIDPYIVPGKPESGLIAGIEGVLADESIIGEADNKRVQSFNYRMCLTTDPTNRVPIAKPPGYDEAEYELLFRLFATGQESSFTTQAMPNHKIDANNHGRMSGDFVGGSYSVAEGWGYGDASYQQRDRMIAAHRRYQQGLLWTMQNHPRVPAAFREKWADWGLSKDEFADNDHWPYQIYVREARRMEGVTTVTQHHVEQKPGYAFADSIGLGSYSLDSHEVRRVLIDGKIRSEGGWYDLVPKSYPLPLGCILPRKGEASNLLVPVTLSATHAAFGGIRMEPTYMILGQSAATVAVLALQKNCAVQDVPYADVAKQLATDKQIL